MRHLSARGRWHDHAQQHDIGKITESRLLVGALAKVDALAFERASKVKKAEMVAVGEQASQHWLSFMFLSAFVTATGIYAVTALGSEPLAADRIVFAMLASGTGQCVQTAFVPGIGRKILWLTGPGFYSVAALALVFDPALRTQALTLLFVTAFAASGLARGIFAIDWLETGWAWLAGSCAVSILVAAIVASLWPSQAVWPLRAGVALDLLVQGAALSGFGLGLRCALGAVLK